MLRGPRILLVLGILLVLVGLLRLVVDVRFHPRPSGSLEDIPSLRERDDLNVVLVLIDTLRADHVGAYGYERDTTPVLDELAARGVRFANAIAQSSWTKSSMASLWLASHPPRTGVKRYMHAVPGSARMPAEILREAGFYTAGLYRNGWVEPTFGFGQGFDVYLKPQPSQPPDKLSQKRRQGRIPGSDWDVTQAAREFLRSFKHRRFLLYLHLMDVHQYTFDDDYALYGSRYADYYDNAVRWTDANIGVLVQELMDLGLFERTLLVIASDHGEEFGEHGQEGHGRTLYREVVTTPLILSLPFRIEEGVVVEDIVENIDVWPTVFDLLGLPPPPHAKGRSLVPLVLGTAGQDGKAAAYSYLDRNWGQVNADDRPFVAVTTPRWRLIKHVSASRVELFDRQADPEESRDVSQQEVEVAAELEGLIDTHLAEAESDPDRIVAEEQEIDEMQLNHLRALGYVIQ